MKALPLTPVVFLLALAQPGHAQPSGEGAAGNPADSRAQAPLLHYQSPFTGYRPFAGGAVGPWRDVNDEVARIGGWKAYAREAYEAAKQAPPADGAAKPTAAPQEPPGAKVK